MPIEVKRKTCLKVNICGAPSSRKSTVCAGLEAKLKQDGIIAETSKEYARHYINTYGVPKELHEQYLITENQNARDNAIAAVAQVLLTDNPAMASYVFGKRMLMAKYAHSNDPYTTYKYLATPAEYKFLEEMHMKALKKTEWFDLIFVFTPEDPVIQDGTRTETERDKLQIYNAIVGFLHVENIPYIPVSGSVEDKIETCYAYIIHELTKP